MGKYFSTFARHEKGRFADDYVATDMAKVRKF